jgi:peptide-methionine (S)-S-oxide reductase
MKTKKGTVATPYSPRRGAESELAIFAAGCFWGVEQEFRKETGVIGTLVGYSGGHTENPSYEEVCDGATGHAEVVLVEYDPSQIRYQDLLNLFWSIHNPTTLNQQGPDFGEQYRSAIFTFTPEQEQLATESRKAVDQSGEWPKPVVTEIAPSKVFYPAEEYHQQYVEKGGMAFCHNRRDRQKFL